MRVRLVGCGGRENALAWRLAMSGDVGELWVDAPHPGWPARARVAAEPADQSAVDLVIVGPEAPLVDGLADRCRANGIACFGPGAAGAQLEASKSYAKDIMQAAGVPTAKHNTVDLDDPALDAVVAERAAGGIVLKADGLAGGKGVFVCDGPHDAAQAVVSLRTTLANSAARVVVEERLTGPETSVFALCDGTRVVGLVSTRDHKRVGDGDTGPNTGGMGAIAPDPRMDPAAVHNVVRTVHEPVLRELASRGISYRGVLYAGLMLTPAGPRVLEFNVRFGDPECQVLMALWDDPLPWLYGAATGSLPDGTPSFRDEHACAVVVAAEGYPAEPITGAPIPSPAPGSTIFYAGASGPADAPVVSGGRVLAATATAPTATQAQAQATALARTLTWPGAHHRTDIGQT